VVLPTIEIGEGAFSGAGDTQQSFDYDRSVRFATYVEPGAILFVVGGAGLVVLAVVALVRRSTAIVVIAAAVVSWRCSSKAVLFLRALEGLE